MATNKNATIRYQTLDRCFRNPSRKYFIDELVDVCNEALFDLNPNSSGITKRQVYEEIKFMKDSRGFETQKIYLRMYMWFTINTNTLKTQIQGVKDYITPEQNDFNEPINIC